MVLRLSRWIVASATALSFVSAALAAAPPADTDREMGCILRRPGLPASFVPERSLERQELLLAVTADATWRQSRVVNPCALAAQRTLPAFVYAGLAARHPERFAAAPAPAPTATAPAASARRLPQYTVVAVDAALPPGTLFFDAVALGRTTAVIGTAYSEIEPGLLRAQVAVIDGGRLQVLAEGFASSVNAGGVIGGAVLTDADNFFTQAAVFRNGRTELIPHLPGQIISGVIALTETGEALVFGIDDSFTRELLSVWDGRHLVPVDFGPEVTSAFLLDMGPTGEIVGTTRIAGAARGFRHDPRTGRTTLLPPQPTETDSWAVAINRRGDVLGYSFLPGARERIGLWRPDGSFEQFFVQGTPEVPTISNALRFNDSERIVVTRISRPASEVGRSFLLPSPGQRVDLSDLVADAPAGFDARYVLEINNVGNLLLLSSDFLPYELLRSPR